MDALAFTQKILENSFFTEEQLATLLHVDQTTVSNWKTGKRKIGSDCFFKLLDILGYSRIDFIKNNYRPKVQLGFKAKSISKEEDLLLISKINKMAANISFMSTIVGDDDNE